MSDRMLIGSWVVSWHKGGWNDKETEEIIYEILWVSLRQGSLLEKLAHQKNLSFEMVDLTAAVGWHWRQWWLFMIVMSSRHVYVWWWWQREGRQHLILEMVGLNGSGSAVEGCQASSKLCHSNLQDPINHRSLIRVFEIFLMDPSSTINRKPHILCFPIEQYLDTHHLKQGSHPNPS